jgi:serine protease Do
MLEKRHSARFKATTCAFIVLAAATFAAAGAASACNRNKLETIPEAVVRPAAEAQKALRVAEDRLGLGRVAERVLPAVVSVASTHASEPQAPELPFDDPFFRRFFGPGAPFDFKGQGGARPPVRGLGSGVIVAGNVILTNAHVVRDAKTLTVTAQNRRRLEVELAGADAKSDLAVLRIKGDTSGLSHLELANSDAAYLGQVVLAVGNPFGVGQTVTMGIVSAKGRADLGIVDYEDFIQTDAAINPGNSGGALVDLEGHLLGIPTAILSRSGGYMGVGFAIPSNMARPIMQSLLETGRVSRSYLGVTIQEVTPELAQALGLKSAQGVLISDVLPEGPSHKAGLMRGDVVLRINDQVMSSTGQLRNVVAAAGVGKTIAVEIWRRGETRRVSVTLGAVPEERAAAIDATAPSGKEAGPLGTTLAPLDAGMRRQLNVPAGVKGGVVVTDVTVGSKAFEAGIRAGDVILELAGTPVASAAQLNQLWQKSSGTVTVLLLRDGRSLYVAVSH